ncbi:MAG: LTA synthase family protein [Bacillota bacterium]|nr:LTA synthase family protein [Bacillota bacterium]
MNSTIKPGKVKKGILKSRLSYVLHDKMAVITFVLLLLKSTFFVNIVESSGSSKLKVNVLNLVYSYSHILFLLLFLSFAFLMNKRARLWFFVIFNILFSVLLIGDLWYYRGFKSFMSLYLFSEVKNLNNLSDSIISMFRPVDIIFVVDLLPVIILALFLNKAYKYKEKARGVFTVLFAFSFGCILFLHLIFDYNGTNYDGPMMFKTQFIPFSTMRFLSPLGYHVYDSFMYVSDHIPYSLSEKDEAEIKKWFEIKNENLPDNQYKGIFSGQNLVVIQVESLENFVVGQKYDNQEITPNLNKLLKNSLYFSNFYEQVNNGNSADADLMINASIYPARRGGTFFRFPANNYITLPELLKEKGYATKALHSDYGYYWNVETALSHFGFDEFKDINSFDHRDTFGMGLTDESFFRQVGSMAENQNSPFYYFMVTSTSHTPFEMPEKFKNLKLPSDFDKTYMGGYFQSVSYTDKQIGAFIDGLDTSGVLDNTTIVIYGDHCGVHKYFGDTVAKIQPQESWWNNDKRIPFIIYHKGMEGKELKVQGGEIDVLPTLAYTLGIDSSKYNNSALGRNLLNTNRDFALLADGTIKGKENLSSEVLQSIQASFDISDKLLRTDYFSK